MIALVWGGLSPHLDTIDWTNVLSVDSAEFSDAEKVEEEAPVPPPVQ